jgi:hypothetical protein
VAKVRLIVEYIFLFIFWFQRRRQLNQMAVSGDEDEGLT